MTILPEGTGIAGYTVKGGTPHYGYKAHVSVDEEHALIRKATLTAANGHDSREFETVLRGDEQMVVADKASANAERSCLGLTAARPKRTASRPAGPTGSWPRRDHTARPHVPAPIFVHSPRREPGN